MDSTPVKAAAGAIDLEFSDEIGHNRKRSQSSALVEDEIPVSPSKTENEVNVLRFLAALNRAKENIEFFGHTECVERSLCELEVAILLYLTEPNKQQDNMEAAASKASAIVSLMEAKRCNNSDTYLGDMTKIQHEIQRCKPEAALASLAHLQEKIQPLRVREVLARLSRIQRDAPEIEDKHVVLFIGRTGAGKSTTVQYLAGQKMVQKPYAITPTRVKKNHFEAENPGPGNLQRVVPSAAMESATKELIPVEVKVGRSGASLFLCDAPGFEDTSGAEQDIIQGYGVIKALRSARSVRIFAIQSSKDLGSRGDGLQNLARILSRMIYGLDMEKMNAVQFGFTLFDDIEDLKADLAGFCNKDVTKESSAYQEVINALESVSHDPLLINPLEGEKVQRILFSLNKLPSIEPRDMFCTTSQRTMNAIERQLQVDVSNVDWAIREGNLPLTSHYLSNVEGLVHLFSDKDRFRAQALTAISSHFNAMNSNAAHALEQRIDADQVIPEEDLVRFKDLVDSVVEAHRLWPSQFPDVASRETLLSELTNIIKRRLEVKRQQEWQLNDGRLGRLIINVKKFAEDFTGTTLEKLYLELVEESQRCAMELSNHAKRCTAEQRFDDLAPILKQLNGACDDIADCCKAESDSTIRSLMAKIDDMIADPVLQKARLGQADVEHLGQSLDALDSLRTSGIEQLLSKFLLDADDSKPFQSPVERLTQKLKAIFDELIAKIQSGLDSSSGEMNSGEAEQLLSQMRLIRNIPQLEAPTAEAYHKTLFAFRQYVTQLHKDAEGAITTLNQQAQKADYGRIAKRLAILQRFRELDKDNAGGASAFDRITEEITDGVATAKDKMIQLCRSNTYNRISKSLKDIVQVYNAVSDMQPLCNYVSPVVDGMRVIDKLLRSAVAPLQAHYSKLFELQSVQLDHSKFRRETLQVALDDFNRVQEQIIADDFQSLAAVKTCLQEAEENLDQVKREGIAQKERLVGLSKAAKDSLREATGVEEQDLIASVKSLSDELASFGVEHESQVKALQDRCTHLQTLLSSTTPLLSIPQLPEDELSWLLSNNSEGVSKLQNELARLKAEAVTLPHSATFNFRAKQLDPKHVDQAMHFYVTVSDVRVWDNIEAENGPIVPPNALEELNRYVVCYAEFFLQDFEFHVEQATSAIAMNGTHFPNIVPSLVHCLERFKTLDRSEEVLNILSGEGKEYAPKVCAKLGELRHRLNAAIETASKEDNRSQLSSLVDVAQSLMEIDFHCDASYVPHGNSFRTLWESSCKLLQDENENGLDGFQKAMDDHNFEEAAQLLSSVSGVSRAKLERLKRDFENALLKFLVALRSSAEDLSAKIEEKDPFASQIIGMTKQLDRDYCIACHAANSADVCGPLRKSAQETLHRCAPDVSQTLTERISLGCQRIKGIIDRDSFAEAEQYLENIQAFREKLANCINTERVDSDIKEVVSKLDKMADHIAQREAFADICKWAEYSPKKLVETLVDLQRKITSTMRYAHAKQSALDGTKACYTNKFEEAEKESDYNKRKLIQADLERAKDYLPAQHMNDFNDRFSRLCSSIELEGQNNEKRREQALASLERANEENFGHVAGLYQDCLQKNPSAAKQISEGITASIHLRKEEVEAARTLREALERFNVMFLYERMFRFHPEVGLIVETTIHQLQKRAKASQEVVQRFTDHDPAQVQTAAEDIHDCLSFPEPKQSKTVFDDALRQTLEGTFEHVKSVLFGWESELETAARDWDLATVSRCGGELLKWAKVVEYIDKVKQLPPMFVTSKVSNTVDHLVMELKKHLETPFVTEDTKQFADRREAAIKDRARWYGRLLILVDPKQFNIHGLDTKVILAVKLHVDKTITDYGESLLQRASQQNLSEEECVEFKAQYELLQDLDKEKQFSKLKLGTKYVQVARNHILEKVKAYRETIETMAAAPGDVNVAAVADTLIEMKKLEQNLLFKSEIYDSIENALRFFKEKQRQQQGVAKLSAVLSLTDYGNKLIADHKALSGEDLRMRREKMQKQDDLELMLQRLEGDDLDKEELRKMFDRYKKVYDVLLQEGLGHLVQGAASPADKAVDKAKSTIQQNRLKGGKFTLSSFIPEALAAVCCVWTLLNTQDYNEDRGNDKMAYVLTPHVAQIVSVFRIFGLGYTGRYTGRSFVSSLRESLVQVGTGEGKSFIMAMVASLFALMGCDVDCSCYSEYLSQRDRDAFATVLQALGIEQFVQYNTFNKICENLLNKSCNIREQIRDAISRNDSTQGGPERLQQSNRPRVLLIDEVDVFLSDRFYGGMYAPSIVVPGGQFKALMDFIWENRGAMNAKYNGYDCKLSWRDLSTSPAYRSCNTVHSKWESVIQEAVRDMLQSLRTFKTIHYRVEADTIQYLEGETYVSNVMHGYQTVWAYYHEFHNKKISPTALASNAGLLLKCGLFSYAEIPSLYQFISGVTGTLKTLSSTEKDILAKEYQVKFQTFMPSVFGESNRNYNPAADVHIVTSKNDYYDAIIRDMDEKCRARRADLVFFSHLQELMDFHDSSHFEIFRKQGNYQVIAENVSAYDREMRVKRAGTEGMITLLTATFGRGTDFVCRNPQLLANGGIHVLQTFYSEEKSEEYQIMGRGARQGDRGSYSMILWDERLEWVLGPDYKTVLEKAKETGRPIHALLDDQREVKYNSKCASKAMGIQQRRQEHAESLAFMKNIQSKSHAPVISYLQKSNKATSAAGSRTVLLMDATGSMSACLEAAKETVCVMFERASAILRDHGLPSDGFQIQFVAYRNYSSCKWGQLLEFSSWESNPTRLRDFMSRIMPAGGQGNEAIEIGLAHAVEQQQEVGIDQVILIGDMPPNTRQDVRDKRSGLFAFGTSAVPDTYWEDELANLGDHRIPVHAFYVSIAAKQVFTEIANRSNGRSAPLEIDGPGGAEMLTAMVTEEILRKAGGAQGDELVREYQKRFSKSYTS